MGSCVGRCFPHGDHRARRSTQGGDGDDDFNYLVEETDSSTTEYKRSSFMSRILSKKKSRAKKHKPVLELVEDLLHSSPGSTYSRLTKSSNRRPAYNPSSVGRSDIPLQCLDVRALLQRAGGTASSTPVSSLDLEWEHEALPVSIHDPSISSWAILPEDHLPDLPSESTTRQADPSVSDWSRVSSADSLEWDPVQSPLRASSPGSVDADTQQLLHEIELLTDQALRETGCGIDS